VSKPTRADSHILNAPVRSAKKVMAKKIDVKPLREEAKAIRGRMAEIRRSRTEANKDLREAQKVVTGIDRMLKKEATALGRVVAKIEKATAK